MANILNIDTSSSQCSVCVAKDGEVILGYESSNKMDHSVTLAPYVEKCLNYLRDNKEKLEAVSVSNGPGSYTGLRIGLSLAKGLCYGLNIPLITIPSLEVLTVRAIFSYPDIMGDEVIVPMIDARRMEVYTGIYDCGLNKKINDQAMILNETSLPELIKEQKVLFIGDGSEKYRSVYKGENGTWLGPLLPHVKYMAPLSEKYFKEQRFSDPAYSVPFYLKEYQATTPKNRI